MEPSLFSFIWKYSRKSQLYLLLFTLFTFPFLYVTLELPKRIINDAIGATSDQIDVWGLQLTQTQFLMVLCLAYLAAVLVHGVLKMRLNTMKGVLAERLLRRFRYTLIERMMRFPSSYFRTTSQGELVAMVTSEAEPMGGLMGDAVAQPVFQAGQMLIIVVFLFAQSLWFGLAGIALIPLQAWIIPLLQRQINLLNKDRIVEVRGLAAEIGETAAGITDLRTNGGWRYRLAGFTDRLGRLFDIRFRIYQKKFFMKFLNNFITQLTPFFFYLVGGYLAIRGDITVGALVAALAAYKDLSSPWKELLTYYNQVQDMSLRWDIVVERFAPSGALDDALFEGEPEELPRLDGIISLQNVTVRNDDGNPVLENLSLEIPAGARVAIQTSSQSERTAIAELLTREVQPARGNVTIAGHNLSTLHQSVIATRIGYAHSRPYLFNGTLGENLLMSLKHSPQTVFWDPKNKDKARIEAKKSGNSPDSIHSDWLDPSLAGLSSPEEIRSWWFKLVEAMGVDEMMFRRMLNSRMDASKYPQLAAKIVGLRQEIHETLKARGADAVVHRFDPDKFNPTIPLGGNLMFAAPARDISQQGLAAEKGFLSLIFEQGLAEQGIAISQTLIETLHQTFGMDGTSHPLFTALGIDEDLYERLVDIASRRRDKGDQALSEDEFALLLTIPFAFTAEQIGPAFPDSFKREILHIRKTKGEALRQETDGLFVQLTPTNYIPRLTVLENALYGRMTSFAGVQGEVVQDIVSEVFQKHDLRRLVTETVLDIPTGLGGTSLPSVFLERAAFSRASIKRPDVLILDHALASHDAESRRETREKMRQLLPDATLIYMEDKFENPDAYDMFIEIQDGHVGDVAETDLDTDESNDLRRKLRIISKVELFAALDPRRRRLLAFSAQWFSAEPGQKVFSQGERADAVYLCLSGQAQMSWEDSNQTVHPVTTISPGRLIGDLAIILNEPRQLDLFAVTGTKFLRIGAEEFKSVIADEPAVLMSLLKTVAGHLSGAADLLREANVDIPQGEGPANPPLE
ncbi:MAG: ABC transporter transmembrane domain-containing protein [Sulfitobacter sp.]